MSSTDPEDATGAEHPQQPDQPTPNPYAQQPGQPYPGQPYPPQPYGYPPQGYGYPPGYAYQPAPATSQKAVWALVLGIISLLGCFCFYIGGFALGIPAVVLGLMARKEIRASQGYQTGGGMATAGLVTGIVGIVLNVLVLALFIAAIATDGFGDPEWDLYGW